jgi:hypothetical protein
MAKRKMLFHPDYVREKSKPVSLSTELDRLPASAIFSSTIRPTEKSALQSSTGAPISLSTYDLIFSAVGPELLQYPMNTSRRSCKSATLPDAFPTFRKFE